MEDRSKVLALEVVPKDMGMRALPVTDNLLVTTQDLVLAPIMAGHQAVGVAAMGVEDEIVAMVGPFFNPP